MQVEEELLPASLEIGFLTMFIEKEEKVFPLLVNFRSPFSSNDYQNIEKREHSDDRKNKPCTVNLAFCS